MGVFDFNKDAGESTKNSGQGTFESHMNSLLPGMLTKFGLVVNDPQVSFSGGVVTITGEAANQATKEKVVLALGNLRGVSQVRDEMTLPGAAEGEEENVETEGRFYTVKRGDSLSKIAKEMYGNAMKYPEIFEANKPMLKDVNLIYPGQVLRIPELA